jgi:PAS domain S-box-containing protein
LNAAAKAQLKVLKKNLPDALWIKDVNGRFILCNYAYEQMMGITEADLVGKTDYEIHPIELANSFRLQDAQAMQSKDAIINLAWVMHAGRGEKRLYETIKCPLLSEVGQVIGVLGSARDITNRRKTAIPPDFPV